MSLDVRGIGGTPECSSCGRTPYIFMDGGETLIESIACRGPRELWWSVWQGAGKSVKCRARRGLWDGLGVEASEAESQNDKYELDSVIR